MTPGGFDASRPASARIFDALLGGRDNFAADREQAARLLEAVPAARDLCARSRAYAGRAVTRLTASGVRQVLDLGCGLPVARKDTAGEMPGMRNLHEAAKAACPGARVVYVDWDPMVISHVAALIRCPGVAAVRADLADAALVLKEAGEHLDLTRPVTVVAAMVAPYWNAGAFAAITAAYTAGLAAGSAVVVTAPWFPSPAAWAQVCEAYTAGTAHNHAPHAVAGFLDGLDVPAGVEIVRGSRPEPADPHPGGCMLGATGHKP